MWRSWLARLVWDQEVEGSSPFTPTKENGSPQGGPFSLLEKRLWFFDADLRSKDAVEGAAGAAVRYLSPRLFHAHACMTATCNLK